VSQKSLKLSIQKCFSIEASGEHEALTIVMRDEEEVDASNGSTTEIVGVGKGREVLKSFHFPRLFFFFLVISSRERVLRPLLVVALHVILTPSRFSRISLFGLWFREFLLHLLWLDVLYARSVLILDLDEMRVCFKSAVDKELVGGRKRIKRL
jgi:hypothetical protein